MSIEIYDTNDSFDFDKLVLTKPSLISGGNYFIRFLVNNGPLYIQPPKCKTKQGFTKSGKKFSCDLMFTNENENFIRWMENLENHCQTFIYKNREKWFDGAMELNDIESYFTSPLKLFKSGKYYILRINANTNAISNKLSIKIYDENENEVELESIIENTNVLTIVEIQGIKCSSRSFQIEIELKQMMTLQQKNIFEKCIIKSSTIKSVGHVNTLVNEVENGIDANIVEKADDLEQLEESEVVGEVEKEKEGEKEVEVEVEKESNESTQLEVETTQQENVDDDNFIKEGEVIPTTVMKITDDMDEVDFHLEDLENIEPFQIKKRNDVYYEMYREARKKAKIARDLALSSYLEAKRIKNTYMLNDLEDSDDSDLENDMEFDVEQSLDE
uniref:Uncharacterized protein n=1 Tax=viral metagenome TaxID=1070528 RepID=A0A6C0JEH6_9ZZZZ